jgi:hypothetical protein
VQRELTLNSLENMKVTHLITATLIALVSSVLGFYTGSYYSKPKPIPFEEALIGGNIDIEYYLEVSEDSIWIENYVTKKVYGGKYSDLDSLVLIDNL